MSQLGRIAGVWGVAVIVATSIAAQDTKKEVFNEDESKVPAYELPEVLVSTAGEKIDTPDKWKQQRRSELLRLFESEVYGRTPSKGPTRIREVVTEGSTDALNGKALRKQITVYFTADDNGPRMDILVYMPKKSKLGIEIKLPEDAAPQEDADDKPSKKNTKKKKPKTKLLVPIFLGYNFEGNHAVTTDPAVKLAHSWLRNNEKLGITENKATEQSRGSEKSRWAIEQIIHRGYAVATIYYGDIDPDFDDDFQNGIEPLFYQDGQSKPDPDEWGSIGAWAWGLSRALDHLDADLEPDPAGVATPEQAGEPDPKAEEEEERQLVNIDLQRVAVLGHSRLGKTSLWAGAQDERFAMVISNNSGCGGAALSKRWFGETVNRINTSFPHWFCDNFNQYNNNEASLPVDSHELIALIAPRPVYIASAVDDKWADPLGEYLAAFHADPVYRLLGTNGLGDAPSASSPAVDKPLLKGQIGYHIRKGAHDVLPYDWEQFMNFADRHFGKK